MRMTLRHNNGGQALLLVVVTVAILFTLTASLYVLTSLTKKNIIGEEEFVRALYAADAGIEKATAKIITEAPADPSWYTGLSASNTSILSGTLPGNSSFAVSASKKTALIGTSLLLESVGQSMDDNGQWVAKKTVRAELPVFTAADYFRGLSILPGKPNLFRYTGNMPVVISGDLLVNGSLGAAESLQVNGTIYTSESSAYIPPGPNLDSHYYKDRAEADGRLFYTDATFINPPDRAASYNGFYFIDGNMAIFGAFAGDAVFFAAGDITITANLVPQSNADGVPEITAGSLTLITPGEIKLENCTVYANLMAKSFAVQGDTVVYGGVCVTDSVFKPGEPGAGSLTIYAGGARPPRPDAIPLAIKIANWKELYPVF